MRMPPHIILALTVLLVCSRVSWAEALYRSTDLVETIETQELTAERIAIDPARKHQLLFLAKTTGEHTLEANVRIRLTNHPSISRLRLAFLDQDNQPLSAGRIELRVLSSEWYRYSQAFYPPADARALRLVLLPGGEATLSVKELVLTTELAVDEAKTLNPNPVFEYGDLNGYGYQCGNGGRFYTRPDGTTIWKSGFCGVSPQFRVEDNAWYSIVCVGKPYRDRKAAIFLQCFEAGARRPFKSMRVAVSEAGESTDLLIPEGTESVSLLCYFILFEKIAITQRPNPILTEE